MHRLIALIAASGVVTLSGQVHAQVLNIDQSAGTSSADTVSTDASMGSNFDPDFIYSLPYSSSLQATNPSNTGSSAMNSNLTYSQFTVNITQAAGAGDYNFAQLNVYFTPTENLTYSFSGSFTYNLGQFTGTAEMLNVTNNNSYVFQDVENGPPGTYTLSGIPNSGGSYSGVLLAGDTYQFLFAISDPNYNGPDGQTLSGQGTLDFSSTVPEPSTWALFAASLAGLLLWRRKAGTRA